MKYLRGLFLTVLLAACSLPTQDREVVATSVELVFTPSPSSTALLIPTRTPTAVPNTPTATPIPCDPVTAEYCITTGSFLFQRPILPPGNDSVDLTYLYASTQNGKRDAHHGVEFQNSFGTPVYAAGDGQVVFASADDIRKFSPWNFFYGNLVIIRHAGDLFTLYAHLSEILVREGDQIHAGDLIGKVGMTGGATGAHLHFEVRKGSDYTEYFSTQNPELWLIPQEGTGAISITLKTILDHNYEHPLVITRFAEGSDDAIFTYYIKSYAKGFEGNAEDAVLNSLPAGRYKIAFNDTSGLRERIVFVEVGKLTEVFFEVK